MRNVVKPIQAVWRRPRFRAFCSSPSGVAGVLIILALIAVAVIAPFFLDHRSQYQDFAAVSRPSSWQYPLGTDSLGRDVFARLLVATRLSLELSLAAAAISLVLGIAIGASAAVMSSRPRGLLLRVIDTMISFPALLVVIAITVVLGKGALSVILGVGIAFSFQYARLTSTLAMSVGGREYVRAARVVNVRGRRLLLRYVLPNIAEPLTVSASTAVASCILVVSALGFLGLGVQPPQFDWGQMLSDGLPYIQTAPLQAVAPAVGIALAALGFGLAGEALARAMNPLLATAQPKKPARGKVKRGADVPAAPAVAVSSGRNGAGEGGHPAPGALRADGVALRVEDLVVTVPTPDGPRDIVKGVSFAIGNGQALGIVGESGSGKTMTALAVAQLTPYPGRVSGRVDLHGEELGAMTKKQLDASLGTELAFVFQDPMSSLNPALRIGGQMTEGIRVHKRVKRSRAREVAAAGLAELHIPAASRQLKRYPHELSGGMRQRVMIAKGLIKEPSLLIADEPTTALDVTVQAQIMDVLGEINQAHGTGVILISHNLALVSQSCHRVIVMYAGRIVEELDSARLPDGARHPYTRALLAAVPEFSSERGRRLRAIPGEAPDVSAPPSGCPYHPRCPLAIDRCRTERPELLTRQEAGTPRVSCHVANADVTGAPEHREEGQLA